jgi:hypothetical protein
VWDALGVPRPADGYKRDFMDDSSLEGALCDERVAHNEVVARRVNEAIEEGLVYRTGATGFVCECGQLGCNAVLELTLAQYEDVRAAPRQFLLCAGHEASFDRVVLRRLTHVVVSKQGLAGRIAAASDPRAES